MSSLFSSHHGVPPISHSAHAYGPGRRMTHNPSSWAIRQNSTSSAWPVQTYSPGFGSCRFQKRYAQTVFRPIALAICNRCRQYSIGTRAAWISPHRICRRWPSSRKSFVPMAKVCWGTGVGASAATHGVERIMVNRQRTRASRGIPRKHSTFNAQRGTPKAGRAKPFDVGR